jgi:hypothetical protein
MEEGVGSVRIAAARVLDGALHAQGKMLVGPKEIKKRCWFKQKSHQQEGPIYYPSCQKRHAAPPTL